MSKKKKIYKISGNLSNKIDLSGLNSDDISSIQSGAIIIPADVFRDELRKGTLLDFINSLVSDIESMNDEVNKKENDGKHYIATYNYKSEKDRDGSIVLNPDSIVIPANVIRDTLSENLLYQLSDFIIRIPVEIKNELSDRTLSHLTNFLNSLVNDLGIASGDSDITDVRGVEMGNINPNVKANNPNQIVDGITSIDMRSFAENTNLNSNFDINNNWPKIMNEPIQDLMEYKGDRKWMKKLINKSIRKETNKVYSRLNKKMDNILSQIYGIDDSICDNHSDINDQIKCMDRLFDINLNKLFDMISGANANKSSSDKIDKGISTVPTDSNQMNDNINILIKPTVSSIDGDDKSTNTICDKDCNEDDNNKKSKGSKK